jgi:hypothetical protein
MKAFNILSGKLQAFEKCLLRDGATRALSSLHDEFARRYQGAEHGRLMRHEQAHLRRALACAERNESSPVVSEARCTELLSRHDELTAAINQTTDENLLAGLVIELSTITAALHEQEQASIAAAMRQSTEPPQADMDSVESADGDDLEDVASNEAPQAEVYFVNGTPSAVSVLQQHDQPHPHQDLPMGISFPTERGEARQVQR